MNHFSVVPKSIQDRFDYHASSLFLYNKMTFWQKLKYPTIISAYNAGLLGNMYPVKQFAINVSSDAHGDMMVVVDPSLKRWRNDVTNQVVEQTGVPTVVVVGSGGEPLSSMSLMDLWSNRYTAVYGIDYTGNANQEEESIGCHLRRKKKTITVEKYIHLFGPVLEQRLSMYMHEHLSKVPQEQWVPVLKLMARPENAIRISKKVVEECVYKDGKKLCEVLTEVGFSNSDIFVNWLSGIVVSGARSTIVKIESVSVGRFSLARAVKHFYQWIVNGRIAEWLRNVFSARVATVVAVPAGGVPGSSGYSDIPAYGAYGASGSYGVPAYVSYGGGGVPMERQERQGLQGLQGLQEPREHRELVMYSSSSSGSDDGSYSSGSDYDIEYPFVESEIGVRFRASNLQRAGSVSIRVLRRGDLVHYLKNNPRGRVPDEAYKRFSKLGTTDVEPGDVVRVFVKRASRDPVSPQGGVLRRSKGFLQRGFRKLGGAKPSADVPDQYVLAVLVENGEKVAFAADHLRGKNQYGGVSFVIPTLSTNTYSVWIYENALNTRNQWVLREKRVLDTPERGRSKSKRALGYDAANLDVYVHDQYMSNLALTSASYEEIKSTAEGCRVDVDSSRSKAAREPPCVTEFLTKLMAMRGTQDEPSFWDNFAYEHAYPKAEAIINVMAVAAGEREPVFPGVGVAQSFAAMPATQGSPSAAGLAMSGSASPAAKMSSVTTTMAETHSASSASQTQTRPRDIPAPVARDGGKPPLPDRELMPSRPEVDEYGWTLKKFRVKTTREGRFNKDDQVYIINSPPRDSDHVYVGGENGQPVEMKRADIDVNLAEDWFDQSRLGMPIGGRLPSVSTSSLVTERERNSKDRVRRSKYYEKFDRHHGFPYDSPEALSRLSTVGAHVDPDRRAATRREIIQNSLEFSDSDDAAEIEANIQGVGTSISLPEEGGEFPFNNPGALGVMQAIGSSIQSSSNALDAIIQDGFELHSKPIGCDLCWNRKKPEGDADFIACPFCAGGGLRTSRKKKEDPKADKIGMELTLLRDNAVHIATLTDKMKHEQREDPDLDVFHDPEILRKIRRMQVLNCVNGKRPVIYRHLVNYLDSNCRIPSDLASGKLIPVWKDRFLYDGKTPMAAYDDKKVLLFHLALDDFDLGDHADLAMDDFEPFDKALTHVVSQGLSKEEAANAFANAEKVCGMVPYPVKTPPANETCVEKYKRERMEWHRLQDGDWADMAQSSNFGDYDVRKDELSMDRVPNSTITIPSPASSSSSGLMPAAAAGIPEPEPESESESGSVSGSESESVSGSESESETEEEEAKPAAATSARGRPAPLPRDEKPEPESESESASGSESESETEDEEPASSKVEASIGNCMRMRHEHYPEFMQFWSQTGPLMAGPEAIFDSSKIYLVLVERPTLFSKIRDIIRAKKMKFRHYLRHRTIVLEPDLRAYNRDSMVYSMDGTMRATIKYKFSPRHNVGMIRVNSGKWKKLWRLPSYGAEGNYFIIKAD